MSQKIINIAYTGIGKAENKNNDLILRIISGVSNSDINIVTNFKDADMILAYPYGSGSVIFRIKWLLFQIIKRIINLKDCSWWLRWILGVGAKPTLFISHENLDRPFWWRMYGSLLIQSNLPRLTYWPKSIDSEGARFPYWYNYVDWPEYPRSNFYTRYGKLYSIEALTRPLNQDSQRINEAVLIASSLEYPRLSILKNLRSHLTVKVFGLAGTQFLGPKYSLMKMYRYAFCGENSIGYGYDSEKIPEAWDAGCIPCGVYLNPCSDFNPEVFIDIGFGDKAAAHEKPLLLKRPSLNEIEEYVKNFINQYDFGYTSLPRG